LGEVNALLTEGIHTTTVMTQRSGSVYSIQRKDLLHFWDQNPGVQLSFLGTFISSRSLPMLMYLLSGTFFVDSVKQDPNRIDNENTEASSW
jgi:hypothetical protein